MKATFTALCLSGLVGFALAATAQEPGASSPDKKGAGDEKKMTVTGCLKEATPGEFELTNAKSDKATAASTYRLSAGASVNLKEHIGHKVEISGEAAAGSVDKPAAPGGAEKFKVTSLKHISPTCEAGK